MPATALDPKTALVVIDLQKGLAAIPTAHPMAGVVANAARLADAFRAKGLPVVLVNVMTVGDGRDFVHARTEMALRSPPPGPEFGELMAELGRTPSDLVITKRQASAFYGTELDLQLRRRGVTGIVLAGVATSIGVDTTARAAHERAFNVTYAIDAMTDRSLEAHEFVRTSIFPRFGESDTTDAILALVARLPGP